MLKNKTTLIIFLFCIVKLTLHLIADFNSGFQGDELLHIETGNHPDIGYMEFPPVIGWLAFIQNQFGSSSVLVHHLFTHIASLLILIIVALTTIELGGKTKAVFLVLLCMLVAPTFGRAHQLFQPVVFTQLFWILSFYQLVRYVKTLDQKYFLYLMLSLAFGFLTKYDIVFFIAGLISLLFFHRTRSVTLANKSTWLSVLLFVVLISPNLWWQYQHQFPVLQMFDRLYETQLDELTVGKVLKDLIISLNPFTIVFWIGGLIFMFNTKNKEAYRPLAISIIVSIAFLAFSKSKAYYFYPAMITLLMFGCVWFEQSILAKRKVILYPTIAVLFISGILLAPYSLSLLSLNSFIKYAHLEKENDHYEVHYQEYYSQEKWNSTLTSMKTVYDSLPGNEKQNCLVWGKHYSQAGAVNLYREQYQLPKAFSYHGSFYLWAEKGLIPETIIAFTNGEAEIDFFQCYFNKVTPVKRVFNPYADFDEDLWQTIYICKNPKQSFDDLKEIFRTRVFE